ncbi:glycosyltransferase [Paracoccus sp. NBH48]|uniref:glycosyltransferase n=1 Tax=Paracoccus sp. NBH48 TaxID=2596918 RepID=UPI0021079ED8|nr:glycosyltransferase [Paracoccus sp. NBH48]
MSEPHVLIVIPALNEARHIDGVLTFAVAFAARVNGLVVVADGGSLDATCDIVRRRAAADPLIRLIDNPGRLQSAGMNLAVDRFGDGAEWLLRLDAHSDYPADYGDALLAEAQRTGADSVVVTMHAEGQGFLQQVIAEAQNSRLGQWRVGTPAGGRWSLGGSRASRSDADRRLSGGGRL